MQVKYSDNQWKRSILVLLTSFWYRQCECHSLLHINKLLKFGVYTQEFFIMAECFNNLLVRSPVQLAWIFVYIFQQPRIPVPFKWHNLISHTLNED